MSSVTIGRDDLPTLAVDKPEVEAGRRARAGLPPTRAAKRLREWTSWSWRSLRSSSRPLCCSGPSAVFVFGVLGSACCAASTHRGSP